jgi:hypothetical protein
MRYTVLYGLVGVVCLMSSLSSVYMLAVEDMRPWPRFIDILVFGVAAFTAMVCAVKVAVAV